jgi:hypothetical protein
MINQVSFTSLRAAGGGPRLSCFPIFKLLQEEGVIQVLPLSYGAAFFPKKRRISSSFSPLQAESPMFPEVVR